MRCAAWSMILAVSTFSCLDATGQVLAAIYAVPPSSGRASLPDAAHGGGARPRLRMELVRTAHSPAAPARRSAHGIEPAFPYRAFPHAACRGGEHRVHGAAVHRCPLRAGAARARRAPHLGRARCGLRRRAAHRAAGRGAFHLGGSPAAGERFADGDLSDADAPAGGARRGAHHALYPRRGSIVVPWCSRWRGPPTAGAHRMFCALA